MSFKVLLFFLYLSCYIYIQYFMSFGPVVDRMLFFRFFFCLLLEKEEKEFNFYMFILYTAKFSY